MAGGFIHRRCTGAHTGYTGHTGDGVSDDFKQLFSLYLRPPGRMRKAGAKTRPARASRPSCYQIN